MAQILDGSQGLGVPLCEQVLLSYGYRYIEDDLVRTRPPRVHARSPLDVRTIKGAPYLLLDDLSGLAQATDCPGDLFSFGNVHIE
jgi:hypothetical protein